MKLLKFEAPWCGACKGQTALFEATPVEGAELVSVNVDDEENQPLVNRYQVMSLPTMVLVEDENNYHKWVGTTPIKDINQYIKSLSKI